MHLTYFTILAIFYHRFFQTLVFPENVYLSDSFICSPGTSNIWYEELIISTPTMIFSSNTTESNLPKTCKKLSKISAAHHYSKDSFVHVQSQPRNYTLKHHSATVSRHLDFKHVQLHEMVRCTLDMYFQTVYYFFVRQPNNQGLSCITLRFLDYTHNLSHKHSVGFISTSGQSIRHSGRYVYNTQKTQATNIQAISGIRTRDPSNQSVTALRHTPHNHRVWNAVYLSQ